MLVKHNLSPFYDMSKEGVNVWSRGESNHSIEGDIIIVKAYSNAAYVTSSSAQIKSDVLAMTQLTVYNVGDTTLRVKNKEWDNVIFLPPGQVKKCTFPTIGSEVLEIVVTENTVARFKAKSSIVNIGTEISDVYLPYKNNLPADKQPLLPPDGEYKEIHAR